jgi:hypothetical protein
MYQKITLTTVAFLCCSIIASAQIKKGSLLLGGQIHYSNSSNEYSPNQSEQTNHNTTFSVSVGKAFKENSVYGINLSYGNASSNNNDGNNNYYKAKTNLYNAGIFYRKYKTLAKDFYLFGEAGASYSGSKNTQTDLSGNKVHITNTTGGQISLAPGISYQLLKKFQVEITFPNIAGVSYTVSKSDQSSKQNNFTFNTSLNSFALDNLEVGFRFVF